jgi:hypothetical protein
MELKDAMDAYFQWMKKAYTSHSSGTPPREWCSMGLEGPITQANIADHFDRTELNEKYEEEYNNGDPETKKPHSYIQAEIDQIYSFHKSFITRHKSRLQLYRDDCAQKNYHTWNAVMLGYGRFLGEKDAADKLGNEI